MKEPREVLAEVFDALLLYIFENIETGDMELVPEDIPTQAIVDFALRPPKNYQLPTGLILSYVCDLLLPDTTETQWLVGRHLLNQLYWAALKEVRTRRGPRSKLADRIFLCVHVEWAYHTLELEEFDEALTLTSERFGVSETKLRRWYLGNKGEAYTERESAKTIQDMFEQVQEVIREVDFMPYLSDSLLSDIEKLD